MVTSAATAATPLTYAFTYQGQLKNAGQPVNGIVTAAFTLYDHPTSGLMLGTQSIPAVDVVNGLFTVTLNQNNEFGSNPASGVQLWLAVVINGQLLTPRQPLTIAPSAGYAISAGAAGSVPWSGLSGVPAGFADNVDNTGPFQLNGTNAYYTGGSVGIGTSTPGSSLEVTGGIRARGGPLGPFGNLNNGYAFTGNGGDNDSGMGSSADGQLEFYSNAIERARMTIDGKWGFGQTTPSGLLEVGDGALAVNDPSSCCSGSDCLDPACRQTVCNIFSFCCSIAWDATCRDLAITNCANCRQKVSVGATTTGGGTLEVTGPIRARGGSLANNNGFSFSGNNGDNDSGMGSLADGEIEFYTNGTERARITSSGALGVGTSTPTTARVEVVHTGIAIQGTGAEGVKGIATPGASHYGIHGVGGAPSQLAGLFDGGVQINGNLCASGTIGTCSDGRFKKNVEGLRRALPIIEKLRPVLFDWKRDAYPERNFSERRQIGLIAQEVQEVAPEIVMKNDDGYLAVDYARLTPLLVEAMKEQQAELDSKQEQIKRQGKQLEALEARLRKLEERSK